jgi:hypothetical protein
MALMPRLSLARALAALVPSVLVTACGGVDETTSTSPDRPVPTPYLGDVPDAPTPSLDAAARAGAAAAAFGELYDVDVPAIVGFYEALLAKAEPGVCPNVYASGTGVAWDGDCVTSGGVRFTGYGSITRYAAAPAGEGFTRTGLDGYADAVIVDADGTSLDIGIYLADYIDTYATLESYVRAHYGSAYASGPGAPASAWLDGTRRGDVVVVMSHHHDSTREAYVDGSMTGLDGALRTVAFGAMYTAVYSDGSVGCADPLGSLSMRDEAGGWYDVVFDGIDPVTYEADPEKCDGCGPTFFAGSAVDATCIDAKGLVGWEGETPW